MKSLCFSALLVSILVVPLYADNFGGGVVIVPTAASGGSGTVANLQTDNNVRYTVNKGGTMTVSGFNTNINPVNSVHIFAQYTVDGGYSGNNALQVNGSNTTIVPADRDYGRWASMDITNLVSTAGQISSLSVTFTNNDGGGGDSVFFDCIYIVVNPTEAILMHPTWVEDFNGTGQADPRVWNYEVGYRRNNEDQYYQSGTANSWQENGHFVIEARKESVGGYQYTSASILTDGKYYWQFGRAQIRAKIPAVTGMWPAIWGTGSQGQWPHGGEVDIMEYYREKILANCAVGGTQQWSAKWDSSSRSMNSLTGVDPGWKDKWHIWTMQWDEQYVRLYCDNILMNTIPQTWLKNSDGYNTSWGPQYPFISNGMNCWLNLAVGGDAGGDPTAAMNSGPKRYLIDYWKIWEGATSNVAPTDIILDSNEVQEGVPIGTVVGNLSAVDADPAEVLRYSLVSGTGSTHNSQFTIPEFISDNTLAGVIKTNQVLDYNDGPTRSIRVRVTDIEGASYTKVFTINILGSKAIDVSASSVSVPEGGTETFQVKLRRSPTSNVTVNVSRQSGDSDITVSGGASLTFTPQNGTDWQTVTLSAAEDADQTNGTAVIRCIDPSGIYTSVTLDAIESENDNNTPLVDAGTDKTIVLATGVPWTPVETATVAWYDANDASTITEASGKVSQWNDKSGNGNHATQTAGARQPSYQATDSMMNNLPTIGSTSASGQIGLDTPIISAKQAYLVAYYKDGVDASFDGYATLLSGPGNWGAYRVMGEIDTANFIASSLFNNTGNYKNGSATNSLSGVLPMPASILKLKSNQTRTQTFGLGYNQDQADRDWQGAYSEFIFTDGAEGIEIEQRMEGYLAHKWGLAANLPANHPYKTAAPGGGGAQVQLVGASVTDPDGDGVTLTWSVVSKPAGATVGFDDASLVDATVTMYVTGTYVLRLTADDGISTPSYDDVTINVSDSNSYSTWAGGNFAHAFVDTGYNANPDGDNTSNLVEFAFGMDPTVPDSRPLSYVANGDVTQHGDPIMHNFANPETPDFRAVFLRRKDHATSGLTYEVQFSADLEQWTTSATTPTILTASNSAGDYEAVSVPCPPTVPAHGGSQNLQPQFFRIEVVID